MTFIRIHLTMFYRCKEYSIVWFYNDWDMTLRWLRRLTCLTKQSYIIVHKLILDKIIEIYLYHREIYPLRQ